MCSSKKRKKKPKNKNRSRTRPGLRCDLGRAPAWVALRPRSRASLGLRGLVLLELHLHLFFFSFFFFFPKFFFAVSTYWAINNYYFWLEIESYRLNFHVDAMWKKCHIRREQPIKIESQKLDLQTLNRVSQTQIASKKYSLETRPTNYIVRILWPFGHFRLNNLFILKEKLNRYLMIKLNYFK